MVLKPNKKYVFINYINGYYLFIKMNKFLIILIFNDFIIIIN